MIQPLENNSQLIRNSMDTVEKDKSTKSFSQFLEASINKVNDLEKKADAKTEAFALGKIDNIHEVTIATEKAKLSLNLTLAVHNKVIDAYNEIMRMQV